MSDELTPEEKTMKALRDQRDFLMKENARLRNLIEQWCNATDRAGAQGAQGAHIDALRQAVGR